MRTKIWVLSMCRINEGGGDVIPAELFISKQDALEAIKHYEETDGYWGCVDWELNEEIIPTATKMR